MIACPPTNSGDLLDLGELTKIDFSTDPDELTKLVSVVCAPDPAELTSLTGSTDQNKARFIFHNFKHPPQP